MDKEHPVVLSEPYEWLAYIYDDVMEHVNYKQWARYLKTIVKSESKNVNKLIDLSCGTGSLLSHLHLNKSNFYAADYSVPMLRMAIQKHIIPGKQYLSLDFKELPFKEKSFSVVLAMYDSINYLLTKELSVQFFREVERILEPGGLLICDAVTPHICKTVFKNYHEAQELENDFSYQRRSWYDAKERIQYNEFKIEHQDKVYEELHEQKIRSIFEWKRIIKQSGLKIVANYANFTFRPFYRKAERVHFVCKKQD